MSSSPHIDFGKLDLRFLEFLCFVIVVAGLSLCELRFTKQFTFNG